MTYFVVNVGCLECGVSTELYGPFETQDEAEKYAASLASWRGGQSKAIVFQSTESNTWREIE